MVSIQTSTIANPEFFDIFVYGTLKKGLSGHHHLEGAEYIGTAITSKKYLLTSNRYPFLSKAKELCYVKGEIYRVDKAKLTILDEYEDVPDYYTREVINVLMDETNEMKEVYAYFCEKEVGKKVHEDGHYLEQIAEIVSEETNNKVVNL